MPKRLTKVLSNYEKGLRNQGAAGSNQKSCVQAIQMALIAVLSEVQQLKNCLLNFGQNHPVNQQGAIHK